MKKLLAQPNQQFIGYEITESLSNELKPYLDIAINKADKVIVNDKLPFSMIDHTLVHTPYNSGYIENRYQFDLTEKNREETKQILLDSFNYPTDLITWELYDNYTILIGCDHVQGILNINESLLNLELEYIKRIDMINQEQWDALLRYTNDYRKGTHTDIFVKHEISDLYKDLKKMDILFDFDWVKWKDGRLLTNNPGTNYFEVKRFELVKILYSLLRADRFSEDLLMNKYKSGYLQKIVKGLINNCHNK